MQKHQKFISGKNITLKELESTKLYKKNPPPKFLTELSKLDRSIVQIRVNRTENGFFLLNGILHKGSYPYFFVELSKSIKNYHGLAIFNPNLIDSIHNNLIILKHSDLSNRENRSAIVLKIPVSPTVSEKELSILRDNINKSVRVKINYGFYVAHKGLVEVSGKLKINKNLYYIQNQNHDIQVSFIEQSISYIVYGYTDDKEIAVIYINL